jgi:putative pyruvate formate lyase activating enzyme
MIVRHLILPNDAAGSEDSLTWLAEEVSPTVTVSIMSQYFPTHRALNIPELARTITGEEYSAVVEVVNRLGLENGWLQELSAPASYRPDFSKGSHPFEAEMGQDSGVTGAE